MTEKDVTQSGPVQQPVLSMRAKQFATTHKVSQAQQCDDWNKAYPAGTKVVVKKSGNGEIYHAVTSSPAWLIDGQSAGIALEGHDMPVKLSELEPASVNDAGELKTVSQDKAAEQSTVSVPTVLAAEIVATFTHCNSEKILSALAEITAVNVGGGIERRVNSIEVYKDRGFVLTLKD